MKAKYGKPSKDNPYIHIEIPEGTPKFQLKMVKDMIKVIRTFAKVAGEDPEKGLEPLKQAQKDLETKLSPSQEG